MTDVEKILSFVLLRLWTRSERPPSGPSPSPFESPASKQFKVFPLSPRVLFEMEMSDMAFQHWTTQTDDFDRASGGGDVGSDAVHTWCQRVKTFSCTVVTQLQLQSQLAKFTSKRETLFSSYTSHVT